MSWTKRKIAQHVESAKLLCKIKSKTLAFIRDNPKTSELDTQNFILEKFIQYGLKNKIAKPIVAFRENTAFVHYYPKVSTNKRLKKNSLILIDIWARLDKKGAPYADITWMAWHGDRVPHKVQKVFKTVIFARDKAIDFIKTGIDQSKNLTGMMIDSVARECVDRNYNGLLLHSTGHEIGFYSPHGRGRPISSRNNRPIKRNLAYTIEPGIYLKGKFGVRSEIDFYLDKNKIKITTDVQRSLTRV